MQETLLRRSTFNFPLLDRSTSIEVLPDDVLLIIFGSYRRSSPMRWHRLTHVCRRWRRIVFASPRGLDLRLYCKPGTPVLKMLDCWPALPINVHFKGCQTFDLPTFEDENNIVAALKHSDHVRSISITVTDSLLEGLRTIELSFPELEDLVLLGEEFHPMPFPAHLRWGTRLRSLRLTGISLTTLPQLLLSSPDLVDLQLYGIVDTRMLSSQTFASALSALTRLQSLSVHFHEHCRSGFVDIPPFCGERVVLPALTDLKFRIRDDDLNSFIARIDAPHLADIEIIFFYRRTIDLSAISQFIDRIDMQKSHGRADIISSDCAVSMSLTRSRPPTRLLLGITGTYLMLDWMLSSMARICDHFSQSLLSVRDLRIESRDSSHGRNAISEKWMEIIRSFSSVGRFHVAGERAAGILQALQPTVGEVTSGALPALTNLYVMGPRTGALHYAIQAIINPRKLSGSPIVGKYISLKSRNKKILQESNVEDESMRILPTRTCRHCNLRLPERQDLIRHPNHRAPPEECEEWCRFCRRPRLQCHSAPWVQRRHRPLNADLLRHPTELPSDSGTLAPTTRSLISESRLNWKPVEYQRSYWRFVPNIRSFCALFNPRLRRQAESAESPNDQLESREAWSIIGNEGLE